MKTSKLFGILLLQLLIFVCNVSFAAMNDVRVTQTYPISHPDWSMTNFWAGEKNPWSRDYTRIMLLEYGRTDITSKTAGRGLIWGFIDATKASEYGKSTLQTAAAGSQSDWLANSFAVKPVGVSAISLGAEWSIFAGEEHIVYALDTSSKKVIKINLDTQTATNIVSYDPTGDPNVTWSPDYSNPRTTGWTSDNLLVVNFTPTSNLSGGYLVNVQTGKRTAYQSYPWAHACTEQAARFPYINAIHSDKAQDGKYRIRYSGSGSGDNGVWFSDWTRSDCNSGTYDQCQTDKSKCPTYVDSNPNSTTHVSWHTNNDWFLGSNVGSPYIKTTDYPPYLADFKIEQIIFDRNSGSFTHNVLLTINTVGVRYTSYGDGIDNYQGGIPDATLRYDNAQFLYVSTSGKYSYEDKDYCNRFPSQSICSTVNVASNRSGYRMYLADLSSSSGAQTCTSFTYSAWSECQPNNTQTRIVTSSSPAGCTGGTPVLEQSCTYTGTSLHRLLKATSTPVIDGNLGEYTLAESLSFSPSSGGNTVTVRTLWDSEAIYFGINVTDSQLNASVTTWDGGVWSEDAIEWFIDTYSDGGSLDPNSAYMRPDDYQGIVNIVNAKYDSQGTVSGTPTSNWNGSWQSAVKLTGTNNNNSDIDSGYTIEIKIPWTSIGYSIPPSADTMVGMSFAIDDKDSSSFSSLMWPNLNVANQNASNWQKVTLSGSFAIVDSTPPEPPVALMIH